MFFLTWLVAYLIPDVPTYIQLLMQRELHLAKEARYSEAFSTLHEERQKSKRFDDIAADVLAMRRGSYDEASPDDAHVAWSLLLFEAWQNNIVTHEATHAFSLMSNVVKLFYDYFYILAFSSKISKLICCPALECFDIVGCVGESNNIHSSLSSRAPTFPKSSLLDTEPNME